MNIQDKIQASLKKRHRTEAIFKSAGIFAITISLLFLIILFSAIFSKGYNAFFGHKIALNIEVKSEYFAKDVSYRNVIKEALMAEFPQESQNVNDRMELYSLLSKAARHEVKDFLQNHQNDIGKSYLVWLTTSSKADIFLKNHFNKNNLEEHSDLSKKQIAILENLHKKNHIKQFFNLKFLTNADSREPEIAGVGASVAGSFFTILIFLICAFPIGVMAGFYLEEFAPKNIFTDIIEVTINNLAAIPSIIYGLLGLILYLNFFQLPRSSSLVGGMVLALLVLPIIIISTRNAINTIPSYIKDAATALGASRVQVMLHHIFPLSIPGIMTGTILAISRALGETAPLLMIGMVAFVADVPSNFTDPTSALPVQIYLWSDSPEPGFAQKTAGAIMVLLTFLIMFNGLAVYLRKKFEKKW